MSEIYKKRDAKKKRANFKGLPELSEMNDN